MYKQQNSYDVGLRSPENSENLFAESGWYLYTPWQASGVSGQCRGCNRRVSHCRSRDSSSRGAVSARWPPLCPRPVETICEPSVLPLAPSFELRTILSHKGMITIHPLSCVLAVAVLECGPHNCSFCGISGRFALEISKVTHISGSKGVRSGYAPSLENVG